VHQFKEDLRKLAARDLAAAVEFAVACAERAVHDALDEEFDAVDAARRLLSGTANAMQCRQAADDVRTVAGMYDERGDSKSAACAWAAYHAAEAVTASVAEVLEHVEHAVLNAARAAAAPRRERQWQQKELRMLLPPQPPGPRLRLSSLASRCTDLASRGATALLWRRS
jgi:ribose 1,5-bisphosphokinase PhnN